MKKRQNPPRKNNDAYEKAKKIVKDSWDKSGAKKITEKVTEKIVKK